jgi:hypothetical protein
MHSCGLGINYFAVFWRQSTLERTARDIINDHPFRIESLIEELPVLQSVEESEYCLLPLFAARQSFGFGYWRKQSHLEFGTSSTAR